MNEIRDKFTTYDNLFGDPADITELDIAELHSFRNHPFRVIDDGSMEELKESIKENGILVPVIVTGTTGAPLRIAILKLPPWNGRNSPSFFDLVPSGKMRTLYPFFK